jgi:hypothetical protein
LPERAGDSECLDLDFGSRKRGEILWVV